MKIEEMFNFYKNILELSTNKVHSEKSLHNRFINYLSLIIATKA
nr:hypothetical protein [Mycoplasmopsis bovis]